MIAAIIENSIVANLVVVDDLDVLPGLIDGEGAAIGDTWNGSAFIKPSAPLPTVAQYTAAIQSMLDAKAQERHYDGILSACTYATSSVSSFAAEGQACVNWRDAVWSESYALMAQVEAGTLAQPTIPALLAMLPVMTWPV